ncbi:MAG: OsmC family protein, partial [Bacteroidota bacterium]|nr:OsmC family protein [Bacteroidota bacterium]
YAQRKQWQVGEIHVKVDLVKEEGIGGSTHSFLCQLSFTGNITEAQQERLLQIDKACPVSKLLAKGAMVTSVMK